ncbi:arylsulfatase [candidate division KSB1 bacterium]|nr:arylsulfatase [candidate division KSB1 bacterium]
MANLCNRREFMRSAGFSLTGLFIASALSCVKSKSNNPNIVLIYADDLGYGDVGCYGAKKIPTPNIDRLAGQGIRFTNAHASSATCTPSRYSMLTGEYAWRQEGTGIARGNAPAIIKPGRQTLPLMLQNAGYTTGVVGKWHLGLGPEGGADWNGEITSAPEDIGFDYSFLIPATGDRVPCVYIESRRVVGLDPSDPIKVSFDEPILEDPTGKDHPELLKVHPSHGHDMTIINGISRIGYMSGGKAARWVDEDMADTITAKAVQFVENNQDKPFFLYFATHDIHVPRVPHQRFAGKSGFGARGDAILQFDWCVGQVLETLDRLKLADNTLVIFASDNGPVVDDGYKDQSVELLQDHKPAGPLRGGKYSAFDAGTRIPFIVRWPGHVSPGESDAPVSQIDLFASLAKLTGQSMPENAGPDSMDQLNTLLGETKEGREYVIEHSLNGTLSIIKDGWKYIEPHKGAKMDKNTNIELGNDPNPQLYNLSKDIGEKNNLAPENPDKVKELSALLEKIKNA